MDKKPTLPPGNAPGGTLGAGIRVSGDLPPLPFQTNEVNKCNGPLKYLPWSTAG